MVTVTAASASAARRLPRPMMMTAVTAILTRKRSRRSSA